MERAVLGTSFVLGAYFVELILLKTDIRREGAFWNNAAHNKIGNIF